MRVKGWRPYITPTIGVYPKKHIPVKPQRRPPPPPPPIFYHEVDESAFQPRRDFRVYASTVHIIQPLLFLSSTAFPAWITFSDTNTALKFYHPITEQEQLWILPKNFDLSNFHVSNLAVSYYSGVEFADFDKLVVFPPPKTENPNYDNCTFLALCNGGELRGCLPDDDKKELESEWVKLSYGESEDLYDDVINFNGKIYVVDREGKLSVITCKHRSRTLSVGKPVISVEDTPETEWRKRLVIDKKRIYLVVRTEEDLFKVYKRMSKLDGDYWEVIEGFEGEKALFMSEDCSFFCEVGLGFVGREYKDCIVFSEGAFPLYGSDRWEHKQSDCEEDDIVIFRLSDGTFARNGEIEDFPKLNWSPPAWIVDDRSQSKRGRDEHDGLDSNDTDENDGEMQSDLMDLDKEQEGMESKPGSKDQNNEIILCDSDSEEKEDEIILCDSDSQEKEDEIILCVSDGQEKEDEEIHFNANIEGMTSLQEELPPSSLGPESRSTKTASPSLSATEEEITRTLLKMNGVNDGTEQGTSSKNVTQSISRACTSSTTKSYISDSATAKFEGFDVRSDLVPTLQKIWRKHGNIVESSTMRSGHIIGRALESLATMVRILEDNSSLSLSDFQADYVTSTLSDLRCMCFKVNWLVPFVEKAIQLHKSKPLLDSLNNLSQLSSKIKERRAILFDKLAKLDEEKNKLKAEMSEVSKMIPFSAQVKFDEPLGSGLT